MACIIVRFVAGPGFVSEAIRRVTGSLFSHVEFGTPEGTWIGAHLRGGVQERPANYARYTREYIYRIPCSQETADRLLALARRDIGTKYNLLDIVGLMVQNRSLTSLHRMMCAQFCTNKMIEALSAARVLNCLMGWTYRITPEILHLSPIFVGNRVSRRG